VTIVLKKGHPTVSDLQSLNVEVIEKEDFLTKKIKSLKIGIINIMPAANLYELNLLIALASVDKCIEPVWIRLENHKYKTTPSTHLEDYYDSFESSLKKNELDGIILTGAPVETFPFEDITYWHELKSIFKIAQEKQISILGLCWGGLAIGKMLGMETEIYDSKLFGVFPSDYLGNYIKGKNFLCPQSRFAGFSDNKMREFEKLGKINLLAYGKNAGYFVFESKNKLMVAHVGHSEYHKGRIVEEAIRDKSLERKDVSPPVNFDVKKPINSWKAHRKEFFSYWIDNILEKEALQKK